MSIEDYEKLLEVNKILTSVDEEYSGCDMKEIYYGDFKKVCSNVREVIDNNIRGE